MLTVLHTADWHLGQSLCGYDRDFEHVRFLEWLLEQLQEQQADVLLLSGDVFDTINPSAVAQKRLYRFLAEAHRASPKLDIVITAGNHDAASRLEAPAQILNALNIHVVGTVPRTPDGDIDVSRLLIPVSNRSGDTAAIVLAIPFLRPSDVPARHDADDPYLQGIAELYQCVTTAAVELRDQQFPEAILLAMGHCHLSGGEESRDSERQLVVGGAEALSPSVFQPELGYVALGHLHRGQRFDQGRIRYSGSPIPLSFSEAGYHHRILKLQCEGRQLLPVESVSVPRTTELLRIPPKGDAVPLDQLLTLLQELPDESHLNPRQYPFLELRVLEDQPDPTRRRRIEEVLQDKAVRLASIKVDRQVARPTVADAEPVDLRTLQEIDPEELFLEEWKSRYADEPSAELIAALQEILLQEPAES